MFKIQVERMSQNEFSDPDGALVIILVIAVALIFIGGIWFTFVCNIYDLCTRRFSPNVESEETEIENEGFEEIEIEFDPSAPPPDYTEIEYNSMSMQKRNSDEISMNSLPTYEDI